MESSCSFYCFSWCELVLQKTKKQETGNFSARIKKVASAEQRTVYALEISGTCAESQTLKLEWDPLLSRIGLTSLEVYTLNLDEVSGMSVQHWVKHYK